MKRPVIFNFRRDAEALVEVLERSARARDRRLNVWRGVKLFVRPWDERRRTQRLVLFAWVRLRQLFADYERSEERIARLCRELAAARDHYNRVGRVIDKWTVRFGDAVALYANAHEPLPPMPPRFLEDGSENPEWLRWWRPETNQQTRAA
jgi:hypothetical protein